MQYFFISLISSLSILFKKSKFSFALIFAVLWILFGWNTSNADYKSYELIYNWSKTQVGLQKLENFEFGFILLCRIGQCLGLDYQIFLRLVSLFGLLLISSTVIRLTANRSYVLSLYLIFPFLMDIVQIRNFLAMSFITYGVQFLLKESKKGMCLYALFVMLASTMHITSLIYLAFLLAKFDKATIFRISMSIFMALLMLYFMNPSKMFDLNKGAGYFSTNTSLRMRTLILFYYVSQVFLTKFAYSYTLKHMSHINPDTTLIYSELIYKLNILMFATYPLTLFNSEFLRLFRNISILNYVSFSNVKGNLSSKGNCFLFRIIILFLTLFNGYMFVFVIFKESVFEPIFEDNSLINCILKIMSP